MSLQVWLPLNGNFNNYGLGTVTPAVPTYNPYNWYNDISGGVISKFYYATNGGGGFNGQQLYCSQLVNKINFSIACWCYINTSKSYAQWSDLFGVKSKVDGKAAAEIYAERRSSSLPSMTGFFMAKNTSINNSNKYYLLQDSESFADKWGHAVIVKDDNNTKFYINGRLAATHDNSNFENSPQKLTGQFYLGMSNSFSYIQDFRIYDHCLSESEIKRLANPEVYHYHLNDLVNGYKSNKTVNIPSEYQEVEYVENDVNGLAFINLGLTIPDPYDGEIKMVGTVASTNLAGTRQFFAGFGPGSKGNYLEFYTNNKIGVFNTYSGPVCKELTPYQFEFGLNKTRTYVTANGVTNTTTGAQSASQFNSGFMFTYDSTAGSSKGIRLYHTTVSDTGIRVRDMHPCYRKSDNTVGFYDTISNTFFTNANSNSGQFIAGPLKKAIPNTYMPIEYIASTHNNEYIDTGVSRQSNKKYIMKLGMSWPNTQARQCNGANGYAYFGVVKGYFQFGDSGEAHSNNIIAKENVKYDAEITIDSVNNKYSYLIRGDGPIYKATLNKSYSTPNLNFYLFRLTQGDQQALGAKCYYAQIYEDGILLRDMQPVLRISDNKPGMYDLVNDIFYPSEGTDDFTWGTQNELTKYNGPGYPDNNGIQNVQTTMALSTPRYGMSTTFGALNTPNIIFGIGDIIAKALTNCSISFWFKKDNSTNSMILSNDSNTRYIGAFGKGSSEAQNNYVSNIGNSVKCYKDGNEYPSSSSSGAAIFFATANITDTNWHHIVYTNCNLSSWTNMKINVYSNWPMNGVLSDFRIFATALSADDVQKLYKMGHIPT